MTRPSPTGHTQPAPIPQPDIASICARAGQGSGDGSPLVAPLVQSTTFCRDGIDSTSPHAYSRVSNPTVAALEQTLGQLEAAPPAVCFGSGLAAETALFLALLSAGDHAVCAKSCYGGTTRLFEEILAPLGVACSFVDATRPEEIAAAVRPETRLIFLETPANPTLELTDIRAAARIAQRCGALLAIDNTFMTPVLQRPLDLGADITVTSTTKFVDGHSAALGGSVVSRDASVLDRLRFIRKCTGGIIAPLNAWLTLQGIKTLPLRLARQSANARRIAEWLGERPEVSRVCYPGLASGAERELAAAQHLGADGAVLSFELDADAESARAFVAALSCCRLVEHVGSVETLITHPASMTHADLSPEQRRAAGIGDALFRLSVGIEEVQPILDDLAAAFARAGIKPGTVSGVSAEEGAARCPASV